MSFLRRLRNVYFVNAMNHRGCKLHQLDKVIEGLFAISYDFSFMFNANLFTYPYDND